MGDSKKNPTIFLLVLDGLCRRQAKWAKCHKETTVTQARSSQGVGVICQAGQNDASSGEPDESFD